MDKEMKNQFKPNYAALPGETLLETIEALGMTQAELAERTGRPKKTINEIIKGRAAITPETALQLERVLGVPASFWNNLERNYQETVARINEQESLQGQVDWLKKLPVSKLTKMGWVKKSTDRIQQLQNVLNFFGVASSEQWESRWMSPTVSYRTSKIFQNNPYAIAAWLRKGELLAQNIDCGHFNVSKFKKALMDIRQLTADLPASFDEIVVNLCAEAGVAVVFVPEIPGIRASGATWWANPNKAVIQLSLRYKRDNHLWFSFFHEAGHILLHGKKEVFIEGDSDGLKEKEADKFASDFLIPPEKYRELLQSNSHNNPAIRRFASELNIAPGIVVGRLQHDNVIEYNFCNNLKRQLEWAKPAIKEEPYS